MTILARPSEWTRTGSSTASPTPAAGGSHHYFAFLSYSHRNQPMANWLHQALERFVVPSHLVGRITDHGPVPKRLTPIFRDLNELPASDDLGHEIRSAIAGSRFLIVLCSPSAARSRWTNAEIEVFKRVRPDGCIFAAIVDGEPFASDLPGREDEECLPKALRFKYDRRGRQTTTKAEPLAADLRGTGEVRRLGFLKLVAGMLGLGLDELVQRDTIRRQRRLATVAGGSLVGMLIATGLAVTAIQGREAARDQRREAEGLVGFMLGDLRAKLEPLGRLDALDSVGARALEYYEKQDKSELSDEALAQRSRALTLMGEIANTRGNLDVALRHYREALSGTAEALRRDSENPQRLFDHAQNIFWVGYIDWQRGDLSRASNAFREYRRLANAMLAVEPRNQKWQLERVYADNALGAVLIEQQKFQEASSVFSQVLRASEDLLAADPNDRSKQDRLVEALAWLSEAREKSGRVDDALALRERQLALLEQLKKTRGADTSLNRAAMTANRATGRLFAARGETGRGLAHLQRSASLAQQLLLTEPNNTEWAQSGAESTLELGELQLATGQVEAAARSARAGCDVGGRLAERDASVKEWRIMTGSCLGLRARLALARNQNGEAEALARQWAELQRNELKRTRSPEFRIAFAEAQLLLGRAMARNGGAARARSAWEAAATTWPNDVELMPRQMAVQAALLEQLGRRAEAERARKQLLATGFRHPALAQIGG
jgi:eukaryotic-like serine/threonine-protein kinase